MMDLLLLDSTSTPLRTGCSKTVLLFISLAWKLILVCCSRLCSIKQNMLLFSRVFERSREHNFMMRLLLLDSTSTSFSTGCSKAVLLFLGLAWSALLWLLYFNFAQYSLLKDRFGCRLILNVLCFNNSYSLCSKKQNILDFSRVF